MTPRLPSSVIRMGSPVLTGAGAAAGHHGELVQGVFAQDGRLLRGLVTLPCTLFGRSCFGRLRGLLRAAVRRGDLAALGRVATASARINQRFHPVPHLGRLLEIVTASGAAGLQVAHSGTVACLLFGPGVPEQRLAAAARRLGELGFRDPWRYRLLPRQ